MFGWLGSVFSAWRWLVASLDSLYNIWNRLDIDATEKIALSVEEHAALLMAALGAVLLAVLAAVYVALRKKTGTGFAAQLYMAVCWLVVMLGTFLIGSSTMALLDRTNGLRGCIKGALASNVDTLLNTLRTMYADVSVSVLGRINDDLRAAYTDWLRMGAEAASGQYSEATSGRQKTLEAFAKPLIEDLATIDEYMDSALYMVKERAGYAAYPDAAFVANRGFDYFSEHIYHGLVLPHYDRWRAGYAALRNHLPRVRDAMEASRQDPRMLARLMIADVVERIEHGAGGSDSGLLPAKVGVAGDSPSEAIKAALQRTLDHMHEKLGVLQRDMLLLGALVAAIVVVAVALAHFRTSTTAGGRVVHKATGGGFVQLLVLPLGGLVAALTWKSWAIQEAHRGTLEAFSRHCRGCSEAPDTLLMTVGGMPISMHSLRAFQSRCRVDDNIAMALVDTRRLMRDVDGTVSVLGIKGIEVDDAAVRLSWDALSGETTKMPTLFIPATASEDTLGKPISSLFRSHCTALRSSACNARYYREIEDDLQVNVDACKRGAEFSMPEKMKAFFAHHARVMAELADFKSTYAARYPRARSDIRSVQNELTAVLQRLEALNEKRILARLEEFHVLSKTTCSAQGDTLRALIKDKLRPDKEPRLKSIEEQLESSAGRIIRPKLQCRQLAADIDSLLLGPMCKQVLPKAQAAGASLRTHLYGMVAVIVGLVLASRIVDWTLRMVWRYVLAGWLLVVLVFIIKTIRRTFSIVLGLGAASVSALLRRQRHGRQASIDVVA